MNQAEKMARVIKLQDDLIKLHQQAGETLRKLQRALQMQAIWPEAFEGGKTCGYCEQSMYWRHKKDAVTQAWLQRSDGEKHHLSRDEAKLFNPDIIIYPKFKEVTHETTTHLRQRQQP